MKSFCKLIFFSLLAVLFCNLVLAQGMPQSPVTLSRLSDNLYEIKGGRGANGGCYIGDNGILVIDSKMDEASVKEVLSAIARITDKPVKYLVNTHSDGDHVAGNIYFPPATNIIAHENCRKEFLLNNRDGSPSNWSKPEMAPFVPSVTFTDRMTIWMGSKKVELSYFGVGHTTGDIVVYFPEEKVAFIGDQVFLGRPALIHSYKGGNSLKQVETINRMLAAIEAEKFCTGHTDPIDRNAVKEFVKSMQQRHEKVKSLIASKKSVDEIKASFPENEAQLIGIIYNELTK